MADNISFNKKIKIIFLQLTLSVILFCICSHHSPVDKYFSSKNKKNSNGDGSDFHNGVKSIFANAWVKYLNLNSLYLFVDNKKYDDQRKDINVKSIQTIRCNEG